MKKTFLIFAMGLIPSLALVSNIYAQQSSVRTLLIKDAKNLLLIPHADTAATGTVNLKSADLSAINTKALKNFDKFFKGATNVGWYKISDGFSAIFTQNENLNRAYFDNKGNVTFTITYYSGKKLPHDIRSMVKGTYYDYEIPFVEEIHAGDKVVYIVHLEDETTWKKVKVSDGEMELIEDFNKS
jgi:hypothetical protein